MNFPDVLALSLLLTSFAQAGPLQDETPPAPKPAPAVAATVDGHAITEEAIEARFQEKLRLQGPNIPPQHHAQVRESWHDQIVEELIDDHFLRREAEAAEVSVTEEEMRAFLERSLQGVLAMRRMTREELSQVFESAQGMGLDAYFDLQVKSPEVRAMLLRAELIEAKYPEKGRVTDEEVAVRYQEQAATNLSSPAMVRASHILITTSPEMSGEEKAAARKRAEEALVLARAPGADFAALAREHSQCPSAAQGGDLDFFPREDAMVEPFAAAAFALEVDGISEVVETQFGFHVILCTARREAFTVPLETAGVWIRDELRLEKTTPIFQQLLTELRAAAKIEYAEKS